ncbi:MAG: hypothetical protein ACM3TU_03580 [Bacillota bacterium]
MRISIIGHSGSGKTTLAEKISQKFEIPHLHLDRLWFEAGGHLLAPGEEGSEKDRVRDYIQEKVRKFIVQENWVSDGLYSRVQADIATRADAVVFIDIPLWRRLLNHAYRIWFTERHPELSLKGELAFFPDMVRRNRVHEPKLQAVVAQFKDKIVHLRSYKEVEQYFADLSTEPL